MRLQTIKSVDGRPEYVLLPMAVYKVLHDSIEREVMRWESQSNDDYVAFDPAEYIENPIALARLRCHVRQIELAELLGVSQAYISKVENQETVSPKLLTRVKNALNQANKQQYQI
jgi:DNA-binding XRE family transcriptional regulator